jgi:Amt family ammonium transporter
MIDPQELIAENRVAMNIVWTLAAGFLVMFMQVGFAMISSGLCRAKNAAHTISMNFMIYPFACAAFWAYGFALGWGNWFRGPRPPGWLSPLGAGTATLDRGLGVGAALDASGQATGGFHCGLLGLKGFFLHGLDDAGVLALFFFMMALMLTAAAIPTGAMAERWRWKSFCLYGLWIALPYTIYANWMWGGGWLAQAGLNWKLGHGAIDFAGSGVVHAMGGIVALAGARALGPRLGKYRDRRPVPMPGHHVPMVLAGTFIVAFGWFGFNAGATLAGSDLRIAVIVVNTTLASIAGALSAMLTLQVKRMKPDPTMMCNGLLAGLVAISASCAFVDAWAAAVIGIVAGALVIYSVFFWEKRGIDDPVGAISVHGVNGLWGLLAVGIFANGHYGAGFNGVVRDDILRGVGKEVGFDGVRGLLYGDSSQFLAQFLALGVLLIFAYAMAYAWFQLSNRITPNRVSRETELMGLDAPEMGALGYPDFSITSRS